MFKLHLVHVVHVVLQLSNACSSASQLPKDGQMSKLYSLPWWKKGVTLIDPFSERNSV